MLDLLKTKRFLPLMITQFLGAFNDNLFKNALLTLIAFRLQENAGVLSYTVAGMFVLPFFILSATAGQVSDKFNRAKIARVLKVTELILMIFVAVVFMTKSVKLLILLLFLMGIQSTFFGPIKYALLPQLLKKKELVAGNAYVEGTTYFSIIFGLLLGTLLPIPAIITLLIFCAVLGYFASRKIPSAPAPQPSLKISVRVFKETYLNLKEAKNYPTVFRCILGATWFWMLGALMVVQVYPLCSGVLKSQESLAAVFLLIFSLGVALGSIACSKILKGMIHATYVPISCIAMSICSIIMFVLTKDSVSETSIGTLDFLLSYKGIELCLTFLSLAFFAGLYIVPLNTLMQYHSPKSHLARIIAANNILNAAGMVAVSVLATGFLSLGFTIPELFLLMGLAGLVVSFYMCLILPDALIKSLIRLVFKVLFRVRIRNMENFKKAGKRVVIIANHTSLLDALLVGAYMPEKVTFAVNTLWSKKWYVRFFSALVNLFPLDPTNPMAIRSLIEEVKKDKKIIIFPEGRITITGGLMKIYEGAGVIADKAQAVLLPLRIKGADKSKLSYMKKKAKTFLFPKIQLCLLEPTTLQVSDDKKGRERRRHLTRELYDVMTQMMYDTSDINKHLFNDLIGAADTFGMNHIIAEDVSRKKLKYKGLLKKTYVLGEEFKSLFEEERVGLMLPNTLASLVCFYALQSVDKIPTMINFSQGPVQIVSCAETVLLKTVITSREFIQKAYLEKTEEALKDAHVKIVYLEDLADQVSLVSKLVDMKNYLCRKLAKHSADKTAVILFTSGSEGMPKAVFLSHKNLQANRYQLSSVLSFNPTDVFFNALPMFHSFGLTIGAVVTILSGVKTFYYPSPLHYRFVPELFYDSNANIICGTDTFLFGYGRMANPYDFYNLKYAIVGGEKLKEATSTLWYEKFGIRILEGYGATETSPVISLNTPMYLRMGTVGRILPRIEYRLEKVAGIEEGGELVLKGDNIMQGYMRPTNKGVLEPPKKGWYNTGDIVQVDEEGFLSIKGRQKRFAKIGGEMVSLVAIEQILDRLYPQTVQAILAVPDARKGEKLVLLTQDKKANLAEIKGYFKEKGYNDLWTPKQVVYQQRIALLGSGKVDYTEAMKFLSTQK